MLQKQGSALALVQKRILLALLLTAPLVLLFQNFTTLSPQSEKPEPNVAANSKAKPFVKPFTVRFSNAEKFDFIRYTLDGRQPSCTSGAVYRAGVDSVAIDPRGQTPGGTSVVVLSAIGCRIAGAANPLTAPLTGEKAFFQNPVAPLKLQLGEEALLEATGSYETTLDQGFYAGSIKPVIFLDHFVCDVREFKFSTSDRMAGTVGCRQILKPGSHVIYGVGQSLPERRTHGGTWNGQVKVTPLSKLNYESTAAFSVKYFLSANGKYDKVTDLYVSPRGNDNADGSQTRPFRTLQKVQEHIKNSDLQNDVTVHIGPGVYREQQVVWDFTMDNHVIRFTGGEGAVSANPNDYPVFDGQCASVCKGGPWFTLNAAKGKASNVHLDHIVIQNYTDGIVIRGNRSQEFQETGWNGFNEISQLYFRQIGNMYNPKAQSGGYAAVQTFNSRFNKIMDNRFESIVNAKSSPGPAEIHAVYFAHYSRNNAVLGNSISSVSGSAIDMRDESNANNISNNVIVRSGSNQTIESWTCIPVNGRTCTKAVLPGNESTPEKPSIHNVLLRNTFTGGNFKGFTVPIAEDSTPDGYAVPSLFYNVGAFNLIN